MIFTPTIINNTLPAVSVTVADSGVPAVTYNQVRNSLGSYVYNVEGLYLYSTNINQINGVIQYQRFDATGNQNYNSIVTIVDPYQLESALNVDLTNAETMFILNGNSSFAATILPNTYVQVKFLTKRITNSFGKNLIAFKEMEKIFRKPNFFNNYGDIEEILETNNEIENNLDTADNNIDNKELEKVEIVSFDGNEKNKNAVAITFLSLAVLSIGYFVFRKKE
jgi:hypothetical protein